MKATVWFTVCNFMVKGISFIAVPIFAFLMTADEYGLSALFMSYQEVLLIAATWELYLGAYQRGLYKYEEEIGPFTVSTLLFMNILTLFCLVIFLTFQGFLTSVSKMPTEVWLVFFCYYFFFPAYNCWMLRKRKAYDYKPVVTCTLLYSLIMAVTPILGMLAFGATATNKIIASLGPITIFCMIFYFKSFRISYIKAAFTRIRIWWLFLVKYQSPLILHSLAFYVLNQSDIIMITYFIGEAQTAYYSVAYSLAMAISILQNSINQSLIPWRYEMLQKGKFERIRSSTASLLVLVGAAVLVFIMLAPDVINLFFAQEYAAAIWCIPPIALSAYFIFLYSIFVNIETYYEKTHYVMYVSVFCALLNIGLNFIGIHFFGYTGCAYATLISYIAFAIGHYFFMRRTVRQINLQDKPVDSRKTFIISAVLVVGMIIATLFYTYPLLRYVLASIAIIIAFVIRKRIKQVLIGLKDIR